MRRDWREHLPRPAVSDPDMHHGTCMKHVPWCMPGSLTRGLLCRWRGKRSQHSRCMRNPQSYVSGKRPMKISVIGYLNWLVVFLWAPHRKGNKSAKGAYTWGSPVCLSMCEGSEYTSLSATKMKIILNVTISKLLILVSMSGIWFGVYINNISTLV